MVGLAVKHISLAIHNRMLIYKKYNHAVVTFIRDSLTTLRSDVICKTMNLYGY